MNLVRCEKGHFYDQDKNGNHCPYCARMAAAAADISSPQQTSPPPVKEKEPAPVRTAQPAPGPGPVRNPAVQPSPAAPIRNPASADEEDNVTIGYYSRVIGVEPVVGWLVCTDGEYKGEGFKLKSGRNFIGRAANMDVILSADHSISRFKHAVVIYEPRSRQFIVATGESHELCYLNGEVVLSNLRMEAYDILDLGNTSLMLIPCCGERFSWEDGLRRK